MAGLIKLGAGKLDHIFTVLEGTERAVLRALTSAIRIHDAETHGHAERVVAFSLHLGRALNLGKWQMRSLELGALLHDIGKIGVPDAILRKPARLTDKEWSRMREHPLLGREILRGIGFLEDATRVVVQHHEKWDGSGYPFGLRREGIDLNARIFAVADAFDAMTSNRVYHAGVPYEAAVTELNRCAGKHFDPVVVEAFCLIPRWELEKAETGGSLYAPVVAAPARMGSGSALRSERIGRRLEDLVI